MADQPTCRWVITDDCHRMNTNEMFNSNLEDCKYCLQGKLIESIRGLKNEQ